MPGKALAAGGPNVPVRVVLDLFCHKGSGAGVLAILDLEAADAGHLVGREGEVVCILGLLGNVLNEDVDLLLGVVLLQRDDVDEIGVLEDLRRPELGRRGDLGRGRLRAGDGGRQQAQERRCEGQGLHIGE